MEENLTPEQTEELKKQLEDAKKQLENTRQKQITSQTNPQDKFIETLFDKGGQMLMAYTQMTSELSRYKADKETEVEKEELKAINLLDTKEKIYKGLLLTVCISALVLSAIFIERAEVVIPVLSLIIGLLFKSSSLSDFFSHRKNKHEKEEEN